MYDGERDENKMLNQSTLLSSGGTAAGATTSIKSRFGDVIVDASKVLSFPRGLLGMPDKSGFVLANFPSPKMEQFKLLQSVDDAALSFITLPIEMQNPIINSKDITQACLDMQIDEKNLALLLIVSVHRTPDQVKLSVNARAPLLVDAERREGVQHVFNSDEYKVQHMLG